MKSNRITLSNHIKEKCKAFADQRIGGSENLYRQRGELNRDKMWYDIYIGTLAEFAVYKQLTKIASNVTKPDLEIYSARNKSYSADLVCDDLFVHVKSQGIKSAEAYGSSWLFSKGDKLFSEDNPEDILVFCIVHDDETVEIKHSISAYDIVKADLLAEPKVYRYKFSKIAIYLQDIIDSEIRSIL